MADFLLTNRYQVHPKLKIGLVHLERKRPWPSCKNPETGNEWSVDMKQRILNLLSRYDEVVRIDQAVKADEDREVRKAVKLCREQNVDVLVGIQPQISDGRLAPVLAQQWDNALVLWATPELQTGQMISGNSLVGTHLMSANLRQLGFPVQMVFGNLDADLTKSQLDRGISVAAASRYLRKAKLGLFGYQAPGFQDLHPNPFIMCKTFGTILQHIGLSEYASFAASLDQETVAKDADGVKFPLKSLASEFGVEKADLTASSRHYLALRNFIEENNLDGLAIRCWPELPGPPPQGMDQWCYLALARLATEGFPIACEGDVDGALGCLAGKLLGCGAVYLSDWLEHDRRHMTLWHGGMAPTQLSEPVGSPLGPCIGRHFNNRKPGCLDATIKICIEVTVYRFWVFDGQYRAVILEGKTVEPIRPLLGNNGRVEFDRDVDLVKGFDRWVQSGFPHHVCVVAGKCADKFLSLAAQLGIKVLQNC